MATNSVILRLHEIGAVKFGTFRHKSGTTSPIHVDLRLVLAHPILLQQISQHFVSAVSSSFDLLCGASATALPIATCFSISTKTPMVLHDCAGAIGKNHNCLVVVEDLDLVDSVLETAASLRKAGLEVTDAVAMIDRELGGREKLEERGIRLHSVVKLSEMVNVLWRFGRVSEEKELEVNTFIQENAARVRVPAESTGEADMEENPTKKLKHNNLCLSADVPTAAAAAEKKGKRTMIKYKPLKHKQLSEGSAMEKESYNAVEDEDEDLQDDGNTDTRKDVDLEKDEFISANKDVSRTSASTSSASSQSSGERKRSSEYISKILEMIRSDIENSKLITELLMRKFEREAEEAKTYSMAECIKVINFMKLTPEVQLESQIYTRAKVMLCTDINYRMGFMMEKSIKEKVSFLEALAKE